MKVLGVAEHLSSLAGKPESIVVRDAVSGSAITRLPLGDWIAQRHGAPYWVLHRADLHAALLSAARRTSLIDIRNGTTIKDAQIGRDDVTATLQASEGESDARGRALIGADGIGSTVRKIIAGDRPGRFLSDFRLSRTIAARGVIATPSSGPFAEPVVTVWLSRQSHVVHYPVRAGKEVSIVAFVDGEAQQSLSGSQLLQRLGASAPALTHEISPIEHWETWPVVGWNPPNYASNGRIALLGDAAHPIRPYLAQGAVLALEDALALAKSLHDHRADVSAALATYATQRLARARRVASASFANGMIYHLPWPASTICNALMARIDGRRVMRGYDWLYGA